MSVCIPTIKGMLQILLENLCKKVIYSMYTFENVYYYIVYCTPYYGRHCRKKIIRQNMAK